MRQSEWFGSVLMVGNLTNCVQFGLSDSLLALRLVQF
jgi:hypothetical protein